MESSKNKHTFLQGKLSEESFSNHHKRDLGLDIPDNYFSTSKSSILDLVKEEKIVPVFYLRRSFQVAASVAALVIMALWFQISSSEPELFVASDDVLIESLFVDDASMNDFVDDLLVSEVVVGAEKSEQDLENIFINSLFVEDTLLDSYTEKSLLDNIIL